MEEWGVVAAQESGGLYDLEQVEHLILSEELEQATDGRDVDVIDDQERIHVKLRIKVVVLQFGEWIAVRPVD